MGCGASHSVIVPIDLSPEPSHQPQTIYIDPPPPPPLVEHKCHIKRILMNAKGEIVDNNSPPGVTVVKGRKPNVTIIEAPTDDTRDYFVSDSLGTADHHYMIDAFDRDSVLTQYTHHNWKVVDIFLFDYDLINPLHVELVEYVNRFNNVWVIGMTSQENNHIDPTLLQKGKVDQWLRKPITRDELLFLVCEAARKTLEPIDNGLPSSSDQRWSVTAISDSSARLRISPSVPLPTPRRRWQLLTASILNNTKK